MLQQNNIYQNCLNANGSLIIKKTETFSNAISSQLYTWYEKNPPIKLNNNNRRYPYN